LFYFVKKSDVQYVYFRYSKKLCGQSHVPLVALWPSFFFWIAIAKKAVQRRRSDGEMGFEPILSGSGAIVFTTAMPAVAPVLLEIPPNCSHFDE